ncbi:MAG: hypothetical protein VKL39_06650 [Leptolyngbyaceae bacterium]|nr:hypothetical protein [Leptolyngbyaceae bacterium]
MTDISGAWLGTFWQEGAQTRFEATFVQAGNSLSGRILDDGPLGEAQVSGDVTGRRITFSKQYVTSHPYAIAYTGTITEEEDFISGTWSMNSGGSGRWEAHRNSDNLMEQLRARMEKKTALAGVAE